MGIFDFLLKPNDKTKGKNPEMFDSKKERVLLSSYKKYKGKRNSSEYFAALPLIDFYYKFRNLDNKYVEECINYCYICISCLDAKDMQGDLRAGISIPAFKRLVIIYENSCNYEKACEVAAKAAKYTRGEDKAYYNEKMKAIKAKMKQ